MAEIGYHPATPSSLTSASPGSIMVRAVGPYLPAGPGTLTELHFYVNVGSGRKFRLGIYRTRDATSQPADLVYSSPELTSTGNAYWHDLTGLSVPLTGAPIWLAVWNADTDIGIKIDTPGGTRGQFQLIAYSSAGAWPDPIASLNLSGSRVAYYGVYTPSSTEIGYHPTIAAEITGATTGTNGVPLLFAAGPFTPASAGTLTELHMYCAAGDGARRIRFCVYADSSGVPGALLYSGAEQSVVSNSWVNLTGLSVALSGAPVWIGAFSNDGGFAVKYLASPNNQFYSVANTYNSVTAPPTPFPAGAASNIMFDIYGVYTVGGASYSRPVSDTGATVSESLALARTLLRAPTETGATVSDATARGTTRPLGDTGLTLTDMTISAAAFAREVADTGQTHSETLQIATPARTVLLDDTGGVISDSITALLGTSHVAVSWVELEIPTIHVVAGVVQRSTSDTGAAVTDTLTRLQLTLTRVLVDQGAAITDTAQWDTPGRDIGVAFGESLVVHLVPLVSLVVEPLQLTLAQNGATVRLTPSGSTVALARLRGRGLRSPL